MKIKVDKNKVKIIDRSSLNDGEYNVTSCEFEFESIYDGLVKKAVFTFEDESYLVLLVDDECQIPAEVLKKGNLKIGVYAYEVEDDELILRYSPAPDYTFIDEGSYVSDAQNSEPVTATDKEQIEQMLSNINLSISKTNGITIISFTNSDGTTQTETVSDGESLEFNWNGTSLGIKTESQSEYIYVNLKGEKGDAGAVNMVVVQALPTENIDESAIYLLPLENPTEDGNNYAEYVYINGAWELLGKIGVHVDLTDYYTKQEVNNLIPDLTDYVKNTDYATYDKGGVFKTSSGQGTNMTASGFLQASVRTYTQYVNGTDNLFIGKGTLENVLNARIGDIDTVLDTINGEVVE